MRAGVPALRFFEWAGDKRATPDLPLGYQYGDARREFAVVESASVPDSFDWYADPNMGGWNVIEGEQH